MSTSLSEAAAYGYVTILLSKSPSIEALSSVIRRGEDLSTAVSRGVLSSDYLRFTRYSDVESLDSVVSEFYKDVFKDLKRYLPSIYKSYTEVFSEIFDLDKAIAIALSSKKAYRSKHMFSELKAFMELAVEGARGGGLGYEKCLGSKRVVECFFSVYLDRLRNALDTISVEMRKSFKTVNTHLAVQSLQLFALTKLYSYIINAERIGLRTAISAKSIVEGHRVPKTVVDRFREVSTYIENEFRANPLHLVVYEAEAVDRAIGHSLFYSTTLIDRLKYIFIRKYYESKLIRFLASRAVLRW